MDDRRFVVFFFLGGGGIVGRTKKTKLATGAIAKQRNNLGYIVPPFSMLVGGEGLLFID